MEPPISRELFLAERGCRVHLSGVAGTFAQCRLLKDAGCEKLFVVSQQAGESACSTRREILARGKEIEVYPFWI